MAILLGCVSSIISSSSRGSLRSRSRPGIYSNQPVRSRLWGEVKDGPVYHNRLWGLSRTGQDTMVTVGDCQGPTRIPQLGGLGPGSRSNFTSGSKSRGFPASQGPAVRKRTIFGGEENISDTGRCCNLFFKISRGGCHVPNHWTWTLSTAVESPQHRHE